MDKKGTYTFATDQSAVWLDAEIETNAEGWIPVPIIDGNSEDQMGKPEVERDLGTRAFISLLSPFKRIPKSRWFELIGVISNQECNNTLTMFPIGLKRDYSPVYDSQFCAFANDHSWFYSNNSGELELIITRVE